jgi:hypothetical protein
VRQFTGLELFHEKRFAIIYEFDKKLDCLFFLGTVPLRELKCQRGRVPGNLFAISQYGPEFASSRAGETSNEENLHKDLVLFALTVGNNYYGEIFGIRLPHR